MTIAESESPRCGAKTTVRDGISLKCSKHQGHQFSHAGEAWAGVAMVTKIWSEPDAKPLAIEDPITGTVSIPKDEYQAIIAALAAAVVLLDCCACYGSDQARARLEDAIGALPMGTIQGDGL